MAATPSSGFAELFTSPSGAVTRSLYAAYLSSALRRGEVYDPSYALLKDRNHYELFSRDVVIAAAMQARKHMVAGTEWSCEGGSQSPVDAKVATLVQELIQHVENFDGARMNLSDAVFQGSKYAKILGSRQIVTLSDGTPRPYWVPTRIVDVDRFRVRRGIDRSANPQKPQWYTEISDAYDGGKWKRLKAAERTWLIEHVYDDAERSLGYGRGLFDAMVHYLYWKTTALTEGLQGLERWAQGWIVLGVDPDRAGSVDRTNDDLVQTAVDQVAKHRGKHILAKMKGDELDYVGGGMEGHQIVMEFVRYCDDAMVRLILGSVLPSGGGEQTGSLARAEVEQESTEILIHFDRRLLESTLTRSLVALVYNLNRPMFETIGLKNSSRPKFSLQPTAQVDVQKAVERVVALIDRGVPLKEDEVYSMTGFTRPGPMDRVIAGKPQGMPGMEEDDPNKYAKAVASLTPEQRATLGLQAEPVEVGA